MKDNTNEIKKTFKDGDRVYFPAHGSGIYRLEWDSLRTGYFTAYDESNNAVCKDLRYDGTSESLFDSVMPIVFHATKRNRELLEQFYGFDFDKYCPQKEVLRIKKSIFCDVRPIGTPYTPTYTSQMVFATITQYEEEDGSPVYMTENGAKFTYATPVSVDLYGNVTQRSWSELLSELDDRKQGYGYEALKNKRWG